MLPGDEVTRASSSAGRQSSDGPGRRPVCRGSVDGSARAVVAHPRISTEMPALCRRSQPHGRSSSSARCLQRSPHGGTRQGGRGGGGRLRGGGLPRGRALGLRPAAAGRARRPGHLRRRAAPAAARGRPDRAGRRGRRVLRRAPARPRRAYGCCCRTSPRPRSSRSPGRRWTGPAATRDDDPVRPRRGVAGRGPGNLPRPGAGRARARPDPGRCGPLGGRDALRDRGPDRGGRAEFARVLDTLQPAD